MTWKRSLLLGLLLAVVLSVALVSAYAATYTDDAKKPYEINWYPLLGNDQADVATVEAAVNTYLKAKLPNTTLKINVMHWGNWTSKMPTMIAAGEYLDMMFTAGWWLGGPYDLQKQGAIIPLDELVTKYGQGLSKALGPAFMTGAKINGKLFAIPVNKEGATQSGYAFNKKYIDKYGFDISKIKKVDDVEPWMQIIKDKEPDIIPMNANGGIPIMNLLPYYYFPEPLPFFVKLDDKTGTIYNRYEDEDYLKYMEITRRWYEKGYVIKDAAANSKWDETCKTGRMFLSMMPLKPGKDKEMSNANVSYVQKELTAVTASTNEATGAMMCISITCKNPVRVMKFLNLMYTDKKLANLLYWGVDGKHYKSAGENYVKPLPNSGWDTTGMQWAFGNQFLCYLMKGETANLDEPADKYSKFMAFNKKAKIFPSTGFYFDNKPYEAELAAMKSIFDEYNGSFGVGAYENPRAKAKEYLGKLRQAGLDTVEKAFKEQYAAWYKTKKK